MFWTIIFDFSSIYNKIFQMSKIKLTETQLKNVVKRVIKEIQGESMTAPAIDFLEYIRRQLKKTYSNSQREIDNTLNTFVRFIEKHDLKTARDMFKDKYETPVIPTSDAQEPEKKVLNRAFFGSKERADQIQKEFEKAQ